MAPAPQQRGPQAEHAGAERSDEPRDQRGLAHHRGAQAALDVIRAVLDVEPIERAAPEGLLRRLRRLDPRDDVFELGAEGPLVRVLPAEPLEDLFRLLVLARAPVQPRTSASGPAKALAAFAHVHATSRQHNQPKKRPRASAPASRKARNPESCPR